MPFTMAVLMYFRLLVIPLHLIFLTHHCQQPALGCQFHSLSKQAGCARLIVRILSAVQA